ncbi:CAP domain-containing protein [Tepidanaerobacter sp. EBM-38]|uniref:CAP domain-containing protein n=1 Tax=Tepidanaerobacter sp. EBM-38 TaxID=1918496 RepID=UPI0025D06863|nr:CAP domain-containing protein [Tepidanaerobacter sp. EBM-38]
MMQYVHKKAAVILLLALVLVMPEVAGAATLYNVKVTINGQTQTFKVPIDLNSITSDSAKTFKFVYTYKDGKWILTSQENILPDKTKPTETLPVKPSEPPKQTTNESEIKGLTADENKMLELVNAEREKVGLAPLENDMRLVEISRKKSKDMIEKNYFAHTSPTYGTPFDALKNNGISYRYAGENLAGAPTVLQAHTSLMNSSGHRANILNPNFTHIGIGIVDGGPYGKMYTQTFIGIK